MSLLANVDFDEQNRTVPEGFALLRIDIIYDSATRVASVIQYVLAVAIVVGCSQKWHLDVHVVQRYLSCMLFSRQRVCDE